MINIKRDQLNQEVKKILLYEIVQGSYSDSEMLPSEKELEDILKVSRGTIRHAVTSLEQEGYVKRQRGIGTFIHREICNIKARIDQKLEFSDLLSQSGYHPSVEVIKIEKYIAGNREAEKLRVKPGHPMISVMKKWNADDRPAIVCTDSFSSDLIKEPYSDDIFINDIFSVLAKLGDVEIDYQVAQLSPCFLDKEHSAALLIPTNIPVLSITGIGYNNSGFPFLYGEEYYAPNIIDLTLIRARI